MTLRTTIQALFACLGLAALASASPIQTINVANCAGEGVRVSLTEIDWTPLGGGTGCIATGFGTSFTYDNGAHTLGSGQTGTIADITAPVSYPITNFLAFPSAPGLTFDVTLLGPGPSNTNCAVSPCAVITGSPIELTLAGGNTSASMDVRGTATDNLGNVYNWNGTFTTQIAGQTPADVQASILAGGHVDTSYSSSLALVFVPEPVSLSLIGGGLIGLALLKRKRNLA